jgi:hypothetical protein
VTPLYRGLGPTRKFVPIQLTANVGSTNALGSILNACTPSQGITANERIADRIRVVAIEYILNFTGNLNVISATNDSSIVRIITATSPDEVYNNSSPAFFEADAFDSNLTLSVSSLNSVSTRAFTSDLVFHSDRMVNANISGSGYQWNNQVHQVDKVNQIISFVPTTTTSSRGSAVIYLCSSSPTLVPTASRPYVDGLVKFHYYDV